MFFKHNTRQFQHSYIYVNERKDKIDGIKQKAAEEIKKEHGEYKASDIKGFLTNNVRKHRISTKTAIAIILVCLILWYILIH